MYLLKVINWLKLLANAVHISWYSGPERPRIVDQDRDHIDRILQILEMKCLEEEFEDSEYGLSMAMLEFYHLGYVIDNARLN